MIISVQSHEYDAWLFDDDEVPICLKVSPYLFFPDFVKRGGLRRTE